MKQKTTYTCECCGKEYQRSMDAYRCEVKCLRMDIESYRKIYAKRNYDTILHSLYEIYHDRKVAKI